MSSKIQKSHSGKQELNSFKRILESLDAAPMKGPSPKDALATSYVQLDSNTQEEIQEITDDVTEAITNVPLRRVLKAYIEEKLKKN